MDKNLAALATANELAVMFGIIRDCGKSRCPVRRVWISLTQPVLFSTVAAVKRWVVVVSA
jgi:hypothetical protein